MTYARVAVNAPGCYKSLSYSIPDTITAEVGQGVWAPFGTRVLCGIILQLSPHTDYEPVRDIIAVSHPQPLLTPEQIAFGCWLSQHYFSPPFSALSLLLPPGWLRRPIAYLEAVGEGESEEEREFLLWLKKSGRVKQEVAETRWGKGRSRQLLPRLLKQGLLSRRYEEEKAKISPRKGGGVGLPTPPPPLPQLPVLPEEALLAEVKESLSRVASGSKPLKQVFLLHGEGRHRLYQHLLAQAVNSGRRCLVLSPQGESDLHHSCLQAFPGRCLGFHDGLSLRRRFDSWQAIKEGNCDIVLGSRSALFTPLSPVGLIIVDEEQDRGYKEERRPPFYHAREVAIKLAQLQKAIVVLGSAAPDVETYYRCQQGEFSLVRLPTEDKGGGVEVVSLPQELRQGQRSPLSRALTQRLAQVINEGGQALLFVHRLGQATSVRCDDCGGVLRCPRCEQPLTYHSREAGLLCHHCGYKGALPQLCPQCHKGRLRLWGLSLEKVEEEMRRLFPQARLASWQEGAGKVKKSQLLSQWAGHQWDIIIATPSLADEPHLSPASLVGIIAGDAGLSFPDFRAGERAYQLLTKLLRLRKMGGGAIIQAYWVDHYALRAAAQEDYQTFYHTEVQHRRRYRYPPFHRLAQLLILATDGRWGELLARRLMTKLEEERQAQGLSLRLLGPAPAYQLWVKGRYRWQILVLGEGIDKLLTPEIIPRGVRVELDPVEV